MAGQCLDPYAAARRMAGRNRIAPVDASWRMAAGSLPLPARGYMVRDPQGGQPQAHPNVGLPETATPTSGGERAITLTPVPADCQRRHTSDWPTAASGRIRPG